jgi:outer membrane lipoprotein-sorting protein
MKAEQIIPDRAFKLFVAIVMVTTATLCIGWGDSWESIRRAGDNVTSIRADFTQEKHMPILTKPLVSKGMLFYQLPDSLRWEYTAPIRSILLQHGGVSKRFVQGREKMIEESGRQLEMVQFMLREIPLWLGGRFDENPLFHAELIDERRIDMRPKEAAMSRIIERVEVTLSSTAGVIESVTVHEGQGVFTRFGFANVQLNKPIDESIFQAVE